MLLESVFLLFEPFGIIWISIMFLSLFVAWNCPKEYISSAISSNRKKALISQLNRLRCLPTRRRFSFEVLLKTEINLSTTVHPNTCIQFSLLDGISEISHHPIRRYLGHICPGSSHACGDRRYGVS